MAVGDFINTKEVAGGNTGTTTLSSGTQSHTAGNLLIVRAFHNYLNAITGIMDTAGNTYHDAGASINDGSRWKTEIWYAYNITGHASNNVTVTWSIATSDFHGLGVDQFQITTTSDPRESASIKTASGSGTTGATATFSTGVATSLIYVSGFTAGLAITAGNAGGSAATLISDGGTATGGVGGEYRYATSTVSSQTSTFTCVSNAWLIASVAFDQVSGGGSTVFGPLLGGRCFSLIQP